MIFNHTIGNISVDGGVFGWKVQANDTLGNINISNIYTFIVVPDTSKPSFLLNQTNATSTAPKISDSLQLNITVVDNTGISTIKLAHNQSGTLSNVTTLSYTEADILLTAIFNLTITMTRGLMQWQIWTNDSRNNINTSQLFTVDIQNTVPITPSIIYPQDGFVYNDIPYINFTSTDVDGDTITYYVYINDTLNTTSTTNITDWNASDGYYNLTVSAYDQFDSSSNISIQFWLDSTSPIIANITVAGLNRSGDTFYINITAMDNMTSINWTISQNQTGVWENTTWSDTWTQSGDWLIAIYNAVISATKNTMIGIIGYVKDEAGNIAQSTTIILSVENMPPTVTNFTFPNQTVYRVKYNISINWSNSSDADGDTIYYRLWVGTSSPPNLLYYNGTNVNWSTNLSEGSYYYSVDVYDGQDYNSNTTIQQLDIDTTSPVISLNFTTPSTTNLDYFIVNLTATDEGDLWSVNTTIVDDSSNIVCSNETVNLSTNSYNYVYNCSF
ncbi:hypothetical protein LCGC14_2387120, partial [marine sediment metagenome]